MGFFDKLAHFIIDLLTRTWSFMKYIAGVIVNSTFGWYTGQPISEEMAAALIYGALLFIAAVYLFFRKSLSLK